MEFFVVDSDRAVPILGNQTMQQMDLVRVQCDSQSTPVKLVSLLNNSQRIIPMSLRILECWRVNTSLKSKRVLRQWFIRKGEFL